MTRFCVVYFLTINRHRQLYCHKCINVIGVLNRFANILDYQKQMFEKLIIECLRCRSCMLWSCLYVGKSALKWERGAMDVGTHADLAV